MPFKANESTLGSEWALLPLVWRSGQWHAISHDSSRLYCWVPDGETFSLEGYKVDEIFAPSSELDAEMIENVFLPVTVESLGLTVDDERLRFVRVSDELVIKFASTMDYPICGLYLNPHDAFGEMDVRGYLEQGVPGFYSSDDTANLVVGSIAINDGKWYLLVDMTGLKPVYFEQAAYPVGPDADWLFGGIHLSTLNPLFGFESLEGGDGSYLYLSLGMQATLEYNELMPETVEEAKAQWLAAYPSLSNLEYGGEIYAENDNDDVEWIPAYPPQVYLL